MGLPVLYSFRRCPYAIRARMALQYSGVTCELREIELKNKPQAMLEVSPKGTVPVLVLGDGQIIDESLNVMYWALEQNSRFEKKEQQKDQPCWLSTDTTIYQALIAENDGAFKYYLDRYKYADRYPEYPKTHYRQQAEKFLQKLEFCLLSRDYLSAESVKFVDIAIFPFIRQFAFVDKNWFDNTSYVNLRNWLGRLLQSELFIVVMQKYKPWHSDAYPVLFASGSNN